MTTSYIVSALLNGVFQMHTSVIFILLGLSMVHGHNKMSEHTRPILEAPVSTAQEIRNHATILGALTMMRYLSYVGNTIMGFGVIGFFLNIAYLIYRIMWSL